MIGSVTWRVDDLEFGVARRQDNAVGKRLPVHGILDVALGPRILRERRGGPSRRNGCSPGDVIAVRVADDHLTRTLRSRCGDGVEMCCLADSRVDQYRIAARKEVGPVACPR